jgi:membrane-associated phospholipid phosphatase
VYKAANPTFAGMILLSVNLMDKLVQWDKWLFVKLNSQWTNPLFDTMAPLWRTPEFWAPLYLFLLLFTISNYKSRGAWWVLFFLCTFVACDMTGTYAFKKVFERIRPCNDPDFSMQVRLLLKQCGGGFSFVSNHAANHFGMGVFAFITLRHVIGKWAWLGIVWAGSVAYAQVYVGVHYPFDVLAGGLIGTIFGISTGTLFNKRYGFAIFGHQSTA